MAYITISNLESIIWRVNLKALNLSGKVYKTKNIEFFNRLETNKLLAVQMLLTNPLKFLNEIYRPIETIDTYKYVKPEKPSSYHKSQECPNISADFNNKEIPESISEKGTDAVKDYRSWFQKNKHLPEDIFSIHHLLAWQVSPPTAIKLANTGWTEKDNYNTEDLESKIDAKIEEANSFINASEQNKIIFKEFMKKFYLVNKKPTELSENKTGCSDEVVIAFLNDFNENIKRPIEKFLIEYYRITLNPDLKFEGNILDQLGLKSCMHCHTFM